MFITPLLNLINPIALKLFLYYIFILILLYLILSIPIIVKLLLFIPIYIFLLIEFYIMEYYYEIKNRFGKNSLISFYSFNKIYEKLKPKLLYKNKHSLHKKLLIFYSILFFIFTSYVIIFNQKPNENHFVSIAKYIVEFDNSLNIFVKTKKFKLPVYQNPVTLKKVQNKKTISTKKKTILYYKLNDETVHANLRTSPAIEKDNVIHTIEKDQILAYKNKKKKDKSGRVWLLVETEESITGWISSRILVKCKN